MPCSACLELSDGASSAGSLPPFLPPRLLPLLTVCNDRQTGAQAKRIQSKNEIFAYLGKLAGEHVSIQFSHGSLCGAYIGKEDSGDPDLASADAQLVDACV